MRLIDADELIEVIKSYHGDMLIDDIIDVISEQPTVNDWIPCSEKLPEDYDTVLAVTTKNHYSVYVYTKEHGFRTGDIDAEGDVIKWKHLTE